MSLRDRVVRSFQEHYGSTCSIVVRAPGRVNLIGEHTDYNDGFVLPMAIDRSVWIALRPTAGPELRVHSLDFSETRSFSLNEVAGGRRDGAEDQDWCEYVMGVAWVLQEAGHTLSPWDGVVAGDVPIGAGLSSSAALEMATARAFAAAAELDWEPGAMARLGQRAENRWIGVNCGIMDQMISASGREGHALLLDCRTLAGELVPLPAGAAVVILDTGTRRGLVDSAYNERRAQCEAAASFFGVRALRDLDPPGFRIRADELDEMTRRRARHVIAENQRTVEAADRMRQGDAAALGALMDASHVSLRDDFEVSSPALDSMVECARRAPGCFGARMTGAGFGGCAVALVAENQVPAFVERAEADYRSATPHHPALYVCRATNGAELA